LKRYNNDRVLIYGDLHAPYQDKGALDFLADINREYKPDRVIDVGDTLDQHPLSRFPKDPSANTVIKEFNKAKKVIKKLGKIFPRVDIMKSNHCERLYMRATHAGIPREYILPYKEVIGAPEGWRWHEDLTITINATRKQIFFAHTKAGSTLNIAKAYGSHVAFGHKHNLFGVQYFTVPSGEYFAIDVGSLISDKGYPFQYNKGSAYRPTRGCFMIVEGQPIPIKY